MLIAVPSKGRAGDVKTLNVIPSATLFVPQSEYDDYVRASFGSRTGEVIPVPDRIRGITATRNWILEFGEFHDRVIFIDDDVLRCGYFDLRRETGRKRQLSEAGWIGEFERLFDVADGMGYRIWGVATDGALRSVYPWKPFVQRTYVTASCMGMFNRGLRFDEAFPVKEDYEICLRCLKEDGGVLGARYLFWSNHHWTGAGGCSEYRTQTMERDAIRRLRLKYPGMIRRVERGGSGYSIELEFKVTK